MEAQACLTSTGHPCITTCIPTITPNTQQILSYLQHLFHPISQVMSHFLQAHLQPTPEDLLFLRAITVSCKICQMSDPNSTHHSPLFYPHARGSIPTLTGICPKSDMSGTSWPWWAPSQGGWRHFPPPTKGLTQSPVSSSRIHSLLWNPATPQSDNYSGFSSQISQTLSKAFNIPWHFHIPSLSLSLSPRER